MAVENSKEPFPRPIPVAEAIKLVEECVFDTSEFRKSLKREAVNIEVNPVHVDEIITELGERANKALVH